jgi:plastocyanin
MKRIAPLAVAVVLVAWSAAGAAQEKTVRQKDKKFSTTSLQAKVGETVSFRNDDPFFHNIFSLSGSQSFDLGSYPPGETRNVTLTKEGKIDVECAIHPEMKMVIEVQK